jgi:hypothetical protein
MRAFRAARACASEFMVIESIRFIYESKQKTLALSKISDMLTSVQNGSGSPGKLAHEPGHPI